MQKQKIYQRRLLKSQKAVSRTKMNPLVRAMHKRQSPYVRKVRNTATFLTTEVAVETVITVSTSTEKHRNAMTILTMIVDGGFVCFPTVTESSPQFRHRVLPRGGTQDQENSGDHFRHHGSTVGARAAPPHTVILQHGHLAGTLLPLRGGSQTRVSFLLCHNISSNTVNSRAGGRTKKEDKTGVGEKN